MSGTMSDDTPKCPTPVNGDSPAERAAKSATYERYLETQRARPQIRHTPSASMAVNRVMKPLAAKSSGSRKRRGSSALALADIWPEIMGPRWSRFSAPVRFRANKDGRTLVISAPGQASALILAASGQILERINAHYGHDYVQGLQVVQAAPDKAAPSAVQPSLRRGLTPGEEARLRDGVSRLGNDRLKDVLARLGREVLRKSE